MTIPRIAGLLLALAVAPGAKALQLGQVSGHSNRGQPLDARIALFGAGADEADVALLPAFGEQAERLLARGVRAALARDVDGAPYIALSSTEPLVASEFSFRVRIIRPGQRLVRAYALTLPVAPAAQPAARRQPPRARPAAMPRAETSLPAEGNYGPVRSGQSLWTILAERGLAGGDVAATMREVVARNPAAFVNGDPSRLRVGAMLSLRGEPREPVVSAGAVPVATTAAAPQDDGIDAETAARLRRLAERYAEIRARYAAQQAAAPTAPATPAHDTPTSAAPPAVAVEADHTAAPVAATLPVASAAARAPAAEPAPTATPRPPAPRPVADEPATPTWRSPLALSLAGLLALGVVGFTLRRLLAARGHSAGGEGRQEADREKVAEIALKAGKRLQLEDEVRRMITGRRAGASAASTLAPAELPRAPRGSMDEIENCIAHGQYDEAEVMLEQVIAEAPENFRAKLRLAEIYYLNERPDEFAELADEIHQRHRRDIGDEHWQRLIRMGKVIAPERPPFSGPVAVEAGRGRR